MILKNEMDRGKFKTPDSFKGKGGARLEYEERLPRTAMGSYNNKRAQDAVNSKRKSSSIVYDGKR